MVTVILSEVEGSMLVRHDVGSFGKFRMTVTLWKDDSLTGSERSRRIRTCCAPADFRRALKRQGYAVTAGVGGGDKAAALLVDLDHLHGTHDRVDRVGQHDLVAALAKLIGNPLAKA
jgi:hypothetical protein